MPTLYDRREIVTPGDLLAEGNYVAGENTYKEDEKVYASRLGLVEYKNKKVSVIALKAFYMPNVGDTVIGVVEDIGFNGWMVDIHAPFPALLRASDVLNRRFNPQEDDLFQILDEGDLVIAKVVAYDRAHNPKLTTDERGLGKVTHGQAVKITPTKVGRVIGKKGSMISVIKKETGCNLTVGNNGVILVTGKSLEDENLAIEAIKKIEVESHTSNLTDRVVQMIKNKKQRRN